jgi:hypothetical protein
VADHPLRPASHLRLGRPLPHQLPNGTRAHLQAAGPKIPTFSHNPSTSWSYAVLASLSGSYPPPKADYPRVTHPCATLLRPKPFLVRLACVKHAASVRSEPGSNSPIFVNLFLQSHSPSGPRRRRSVRRGGLIADLRVRSQELFGAEIVFFRRAAPDAGFGTLTPLVHGAKQLRLSFPSAQALVCGCMGTPSCRFAPI